MDAGLATGLFAVIGVLIPALFTYAGVRFTQRSARAAQERTDQLDRAKVDADAYEQARLTWDEHVESLREQVRDLRDEAEAQRQAARELRARVDDLESGRASDRRTIAELTEHVRVITQYARILLGILDEREVVYPPPPAGML